MYTSIYPHVTLLICRTLCLSSTLLLAALGLRKVPSSRESVRTLLTSGASRCARHGPALILHSCPLSCFFLSVSLLLFSLQYPSRWFILETNYDHWKPVPSGDDRRGPANAFMNAQSSAFVNQSTMLELLRSVPMLNSETTYTTVMRYCCWCWCLC